MIKIIKGIIIHTLISIAFGCSLSLFFGFLALHLYHDTTLISITFY
jgi:hypothetical protein